MLEKNNIDWYSFCVEENENYPKGCDRRIIDWARSKEPASCSARGCLGQGKNLPEGCFCLKHYMLRPKCIEDGCHRPALDIKGWKRYAAILVCRKHLYDSEEAAEAYSEQVSWMCGPSCHYGKVIDEW